MISYELALRLKEAGFPQGELPDLLGFEHQEGDTLHHCGDCVFTQGQWVRLATIEDLLQELPKQNKDEESLTLRYETWNLESGKVWVAGYNWHQERDLNDEQWGATPEEALANLYLALHPQTI